MIEKNPKNIKRTYNSEASKDREKLHIILYTVNQANLPGSLKFSTVLLFHFTVKGIGRHNVRLMKEGRKLQGKEEEKSLIKL